jgi:hypothetical protein
MKWRFFASPKANSVRFKHLPPLFVSAVEVKLQVARETTVNEY